MCPQKVRKSELGDAVILDADTDTVTTEFDDVASMPSDVVSLKIILALYSFTCIIKFMLVLNLFIYRIVILCMCVIFL